MTASEKLMALHVNWKASGEYGVGTPYVVCDQLPLIADVVEAAELYFAAHDRGEQGHQAHVRSALTALRDALQPEGDRT